MTDRLYSESFFYDALSINLNWTKTIEFNGFFLNLKTLKRVISKNQQTKLFRM